MAKPKIKYRETYTKGSMLHKDLVQAMLDINGVEVEAKQSTLYDDESEELTLSLKMTSEQAQQFKTAHAEMEG